MSTTKVQVSFLSDLWVAFFHLGGSFASAAVVVQCSGAAAFLLLNYFQRLPMLVSIEPALLLAPSPAAQVLPAALSVGLSCVVTASELCKASFSPPRLLSSDWQTSLLPGALAGRLPWYIVAMPHYCCFAILAARSVGFHAAGSARFHSALVDGLQVLPIALAPAVFVASCVFVLVVWPFVWHLLAAAQPLLLILLCHIDQSGF